MGRDIEGAARVKKMAETQAAATMKTVVPRDLPAGFSGSRGSVACACSALHLPGPFVITVITCFNNRAPLSPLLASPQSLLDHADG